MSSIREIAEKVAQENVIYLPDRSFVNSALLTDAVEQAIRNERERCAKIADERAAFKPSLSWDLQDWRSNG